jgi:hypothetical protein
MKPLYLAALLLLVAAPAAAQLRPLEPLPAGILRSPDATVLAEVGAGVFAGQRASFAGTEGTLGEIGNFRAFWRTGRVVLEIGGTVLRLFEDKSRFADPYGGADAEPGPRRRDAGDYRIATTVRLSPEAWQSAAGYVRFGTRLPTTDNTVGLDRDRTDFFAVFGALIDRGPVRVGAEAGVGIFGTHHPTLEQSDVLVYSASAEYRLGSIAPGIAVLGHVDGLEDRSVRGSEELAEVRAGARIGRRYWLDARWVAGLTDFSPRSGVLLSAGLAH